MGVVKAMKVVLEHGKRATARFPLLIFVILGLTGVGAFCWWAFRTIHWGFDWGQLNRWANNHLALLLLAGLASFAVSIFISTFSYKKVLDMPPDEYILWLHQRSTRVVFPFFSAIHDVIRRRSGIYRWWHLQAFSSLIHLGLLGLFLVVGGHWFTQAIPHALASHGCADAVSVTANTTWSTNQCHGDVTISNGATLTINGGITADLSSLTLGNGITDGFVTAKGDTLNNLGVTINVDGNVEVKASSSISADGQGYTGGGSPGSNGNGPGGGVNASAAGGGGGYGGNGGVPSSVPAATGGIAYGSIDQPIDLGSGGAYASGSGGNGGGAIKISAAGTITVSGTISAKGTDGSCCSGRAGGSGGSIWLIADTLTGSGTIDSSGGAYTNASTGGSGSGGRIRLTYNTNSSTTTNKAYSGSALNAGAGTISTSGGLTISNFASATSASVGLTPLTDASYSYAATTITNGAYVTIANNTSFAGGTTALQGGARLSLLGNNTVLSGGSLTVSGSSQTETLDVPASIATEPTFSSITVSSGTTLQHSANSITDSTHLILKSTGSVTITGNINLDGLGYTGALGAGGDGNGPGAGQKIGTSASGAGYGGDGSNWNGGSPLPTGGAGYGSVDAPANIGSGGGAPNSNNNAGGSGGGALKIIATSGTVTIGGAISAKGNAGGFCGCGDRPAGGGSGGSIWVIADTLVGSGSLSVNGAGSAASGGGRIRVTYNTDSSTVASTAYGGGNGLAGAGTISTSAGLFVSNFASATSSPGLTKLNESSYSYSSTTLKNGGNVIIGSSTSFTGGTLSVPTGTVTLSTPPSVTANFSTVTVSSGATLGHQANTTTHLYSLNISATGSVTITGNITVDGQGYAGGTAPGNGYGTGGGTGGASYARGGGGAYGGNGGTGIACCAASGGAGGTAYGSLTQPVDLGSGGGAGGGAGHFGGAGGGAVKITSSGTITVNGSVTANGGNATVSDDAGGSGGSIWLIAPTFAGSGTVTANGGGPSSGTAGGAGGGGRVVITYTTNSSSVTPTAKTHATLGVAGAPGTVMMNSDLTIDGGTISTVATTPLSDSSYTLTGTTFKGTAIVVSIGASTTFSGGALSIPSGSVKLNIDKSGLTPSFSTINLASGATLTQDANATTHTYSINLTASGNVTIAGTVSMNAKGFSGGTAPGDGYGTGGGVGAGGYNFGAGGGYGGRGGDSTNSGGIATGGSTYGSAVQPTDIGSGGGAGAGSNHFGGQGGGAVKIVSGATFTMSGTITVNGGNGTTSSDGGGSGGSIWIAGSTLTGSGTLSSNGGSPASGTSAGCGGGGRISRHATSDTFAGTLTTTKGSGNCTNGTNGTNQTVGAVTHFTVSGYPSPVSAGATGSVTVTALDASNNQNYAYTKTVTFSSSDTQAILPSNYAFTVTDAGSHIFTNGVTLKSAGTQSITVDQSDDGSVDGTQSSITVNPGSASTLAVTGISDPVVAGTVSNATVTAKDAYNNTATNYTGTVTFSSSDPLVVLPGNYSFVGGDNGTHTFTNAVTLKTTGEQTVTATDTVTGSITGTQSNVTVASAAASSLEVTGFSSPVTAGTVGSVTVRAIDNFSNTATDYAGTIAFSSSDAQAVLPSNYTFVGGDNGAHAFTNAIALKTAGNRSISVADSNNGALTGAQANITVNPAATSKLVITTSPTTLTAGEETTAYVVTRRDAYNNATTSGSQTVDVSSTSTEATKEFRDSSGGAAVSQVTINAAASTQDFFYYDEAAGSWTISVAGSGLTGDSKTLTVNTGVADHFDFTGLPASQTAGNAESVTISVRDSFNNTVIGYDGTVGFTSTDAQAVLPADYTFTPSDSGAHSFTNSVTLKTAGSQSVTVSDGTVSATQAGVTVTPAIASQFSLTNIASTVSADDILSPTITVKDAYGNNAPGFAGSAHFTSSDAAAVLPADYTFTPSDNGGHTFTSTLRLKTAGTQSVSVTIDSGGSATLTQSGITVTPGVATLLRFTGIEVNQAVGAPFSFTVKAEDSAGNTATGYIGTVGFSSSDAAAKLPASYTFTAAEAGSHAFENGATFATAGTHSLTVTDAVHSDITGTVTGLIVAAVPGNEKNDNGNNGLGGVKSASEKKVCQIQGKLVTEIDGKIFVGTITLSVQDDGSLKGTIRGKLDGHQVFGSFSATSYTTKIISGTITITKSTGQTETVALIGQTKAGDITLTKAQSCVVRAGIDFGAKPGDDTDPATDSGSGTTVVSIDEPLTDDAPLTAPVDASVNGQGATGGALDTLVAGEVTTTLGDIVISPISPKFTTLEIRDVSSAAAVLVGGASTLSLIPALQTGAMTSSMNGVPLMQWLFVGFRPKRRNRRKWGIARDRLTGAPAAGVMVSLLNESGETVRQMRTDNTGRFGFLIDQVGRYRLAVNNPLYRPYESSAIAVVSPEKTIISQPINLVPEIERLTQASQRLRRVLTVLRDLDYLNWLILLAGTVFAVSTYVQDASFIKLLLVEFYGLIWLSRLLFLRRPRTVGQVTDGSGAPISNAIVQVSGTADGVEQHIYSTVTDTFGRFILLVKPDVYDVVIAKEGYAAKHQTIEGDDVTVAVKLEPGNLEI